MENNREKYIPAGKKKALIVDDEEINRELLGYIVSSDFDPIYAENGAEAMERIRENSDTLSVILLDIMMPVMGGFEVLEQLQNDLTLSQIPVIVLTSAEENEAKILKMGAFDFIAKPFKAAEVVLARILKAVELSEDRFIIQATERENLTEFLSKDFFFNYAQQYDKRHAGAKMDALAFDVNHFHLVNEIYGRHRGDQVLMDISDQLRKLIIRTGGMATRMNGDIFLSYLPDKDLDYEEILSELNDSLPLLKDLNIKLRAGVYKNVDKTLPVEDRFHRAQRAIDRAENSFSRLVAYYDEKKYQEDIYREQLVNEMPSSLEKGEFEVYFQPKFDISRDTPAIASAEALVRWFHPSKGLISPGVFIPLFEEHGLIRVLDRYVWRKTAGYIRKWEEELGYSVPISVNVSRINLFDHNLPEIMTSIMQEQGLSADHIYLEITESIYKDMSDLYKRQINELKRRGFQIEMDDFPSGYSSLSMLADFPVDVLKLDMSMVRDITHSSKKEQIVGMVMELANFLNLKVVAEGVEEKEQVDLLKSLGCKLIQGYYFAKPMPEPEFREIMRKERKLC